MAPLRNDMTRAAMARHGWLADLAVVQLPGNPALLVSGNLGGRSISTYAGAVNLDVTDLESVDAVLRGMELDPDIENMPDAGRVDRYVGHALSLPHIECLSVVPHIDGMSPRVDMIAPGIGRVQQMVDEKPLETHLRKALRHRRQDSEGRTITRFGAMSLAIAAEDGEDLDRILDTAFVADDLTYRNIGMRVSFGTKVQPLIRSNGAIILPDGIEILHLPETIKIALRSGDMDGKPLARVVDMPGFEGLRIGTINRQTSLNRLSAGGGGGWIKIHVRDEHNAKFEDIEIEEARAAAHGTLARRLAAGVKTENTR